MSEILFQTVDYSGVGLPYLEVESLEEPLNLLLDTGAPTFFLQPGVIDTNDLLTEGTSIVSDGFGNEEEVINIYSLPFSVKKCSGACSFVAYRGLERYGSGIEILGLDGALNPSQLAWNGCVTINFKSAEVFVIRNLAPESKSTCKTPSSASTDGISLSHKYIGRIEMENHGELTALFDTGSSGTIISATVVDPDKVLKNEKTLKGYNISGSFNTYPGFDVILSNRRITVTEATVVDKALPHNVDIVLGIDALRDASMQVAFDSPPTFYWE